MKLVALAAAAALTGPFDADPDSNAARQAEKYERQGRPTAARLMWSLSRVPQAFWLTGGSPKEVRRDVGRIVGRATTRPGSTASPEASGDETRPSSSSPTRSPRAAARAT
jgi:hypothetical protein